MLYWLEIYALIAAVMFAVAGLFLLVGCVWCELEVWLRRGANPSVVNRIAVSNALASGGSDNE